MRYAVVADLHGRLDRLGPIMEAAAGHGARLVLLGDYLEAKVSKRDLRGGRPLEEVVDRDEPLWELAARELLVLGNQEERIARALRHPGTPEAADSPEAPEAPDSPEAPEGAGFPGVPDVLRPLLSAPPRLETARALFVHGHEFDWFRIEGGVWSPKLPEPPDLPVTIYGHSHRPALIRITASPDALMYEALPAAAGVPQALDGDHLVNAGPARDGHWLLYDDEARTVTFHGGDAPAGGRCRTRRPREDASGRLVIIGGKSPQAAARRLGVETLFVEDPGRFGQAARAERALLMDYARDPELLRSMVAAHHEIRPVRSVLSMTEPGLVPAARLRDELGLPGPSPRTSELLRDKRRMRELLDGWRGMAVAWAAGETPADVVRFGARHGFPCVVKPAGGSASRGVTRVDGPGDVAAAIARLPGEGFLIEEFLDGPEVSVETVSFGGEHAVVAVTAKGIDAGFVEISHMVPAGLSPEELEEVAALVRTFLDLTGLQDGAAHTEVVLTGAGPRIVESHDRVGGDRINDLVRLAYGIDMVEATVAWLACGRRPAAIPETPSRGAAITFLTPPLTGPDARGVVTAVDGVDEARAGAHLVKIRVAPGDRVTAVRDSGDRLGYVLATGRTGPDALERSRALAGRVRISVKEEA
ncbi:ATP-grasp domain-containing protein [Microbispora sp. NPDC049125]|uniref:ATP-grasp domain-containing protein n=1 Tax=Microbispora sp. NPDC049125 TaxID=3154929 RepID=UPI0034657E6E